MRFPQLWLPTFFALSCAGTFILGAEEAPLAAVKHTRLNVVGSDSLFVTVNRSDATATLKIWIESLGKIRGFAVATKLDVLQTSAEMRLRLKEQSVDLLVLDTPDYLALAEIRLVDAVAAGTYRGRIAAYPYLLLVHDATGARQLAELRGKRVGVSSRTKSNMGLLWLETLLAESRLGRASRFFAALDTTYRASSCVLPLFFGRLDACVVDSANWDLLKELNPQLGKLRMLGASEPLLEGLAAMPVQPHPSQPPLYRSALVDSIMSLHKQPAGAQLGIVFKTGPLVPVGYEHFDSVRNLCNRYRRLVDPSWVGSHVAAGTAGGRQQEGAGKGGPPSVYDGKAQ